MPDILLHPATQQNIDRLVKNPFHAVGLSAGEGSGKKFLAEYVARSILDSTNNIYLKVVDCSEKEGIAGVREAISFLSLRMPGDGKYKRAVIFTDLHQLGHEGQNALLKTLEEPPDDTLIIITTNSKSDVLPTISSRLIWLDVLPVEVQDSVSFFSKSYEREKIVNAYFITDGKIGMMKEILEQYDDHPLILCLQDAKRVIRMNKFERLNYVNELIKNDGYEVKSYLWALEKVLHTVLKTQVEKNGTINQKIFHSLKLILSARNAQDYNVNQKALLTELFYSL